MSYTLAMAQQLVVYVPEMYRHDPALEVIPVEIVAYVIAFLLEHNVMQLDTLEALVISV